MKELQQQEMNPLSSSLTCDVKLKIQLLINSVMRHFAAKGGILVIMGRVYSQISVSSVVAVSSWFAYDRVWRLDLLSISHPGEKDRRRIVTECSAKQLAFSPQCDPLLRNRQSGGS